MRIAPASGLMAAAMLAVMIAAPAGRAEDGAVARGEQAKPSSEQAAPVEAAVGDSTGNSASATAEHPGRRIFMDHNCALCHTAYARGIGELPEDTGDGVDEVGEAAAAAGPPDLSTLAGTWTAGLLREYLVDRVELNGAKHVTSFKGSDEEWAALDDWLLLSRAPADTAAADADAADPRSNGEK